MCLLQICCPPGIRNLQYLHDCVRVCVLQIQNITNYAMQTLMAAGVELVPFDSQALNDVSADAWGDNTESYAFEDTDTLAR